MKGSLGFISPIRRLTEEEKFLMDLDLSGQTVYDIGGYEGAFTIFFARAVGKNGRVITFEPHPDNAKKITENVRLNKFDNVGVRRIGLGKRRGKATLAFRHSELATASVQEDSKARILQEKGAKAIQIEIDSLDSQITANNLPKPDFIKIDVEGLEMDVLLGMGETIKGYKPKLFIEIHGVDIKRKTENVQRVAEFLLAGGYSLYHVESQQVVTAADIQIAKEGHLYCS
ncbi:unnamed protein product [marine sediment metagenome]|uniref:Methyltransferase FkbM domain-containing protein n=1 Tax=marine sediment metagenome TaxID=412755 RepID=X0SDE5_9ZZZZ